MNYFGIFGAALLLSCANTMAEDCSSEQLVNKPGIGKKMIECMIQLNKENEALKKRVDESEKNVLIFGRVGVSGVAQGDIIVSNSQVEAEIKRIDIVPDKKNSNIMLSAKGAYQLTIRASSIRSFDVHKCYFSAISRIDREGMDNNEPPVYMRTFFAETNDGPTIIFNPVSIVSKDSVNAEFEFFGVCRMKG